MAVTVATFRVRFPEFADVPTYPDARIQLFLDITAKQMSEDCWGDLFDEGTNLLTAHKLWLNTQTATDGGDVNNAGPDQTQTADKVSYSKQSLTIDANTWKLSLMSTPYGLQYLELMGLVEPGCSYMVISDIRT